MTNQQQRNYSQLMDSLPELVCQEPDKNRAQACAMHQLVGHQKKPVRAEVGGLRRQDMPHNQRHMFAAAA